MLNQKPFTYLAALGDTNDPATWSGTPYHFLKSAKAAGLIDEGLVLRRSGLPWALRRLVWNACQILRGRRHGGFQYQPNFLERLFSSVRSTITNARVINCFQLYPPSIVLDHRVEKWFYIDMTLRQLFESYGQDLDDRTKAEAIERERRGYHAAKMVMTLSQWAANSVVRDYGVPPDRVRTVIPGANLDPVEYAAWETDSSQREADAEAPLRLVFVGKYWRRKGLDTLIDAFAYARGRGALVTLSIIGVPRASVPSKYRSVQGVEWIGFLNKRHDAAHFLRALAGNDVGCLLSRSDASPIAVREFCAAGLITLCSDVCGAKEMTLPGASIVIPASASKSAIGDQIVSLCSDRTRRKEMATIAWQFRSQAGWDETCRRILEFWPEPRTVI